jgi:hypothetical protein
LQARPNARKSIFSLITFLRVSETFGQEGTFFGKKSKDKPPRLLEKRQFWSFSAKKNPGLMVGQNFETFDQEGLDFHQEN